MNTLIWGITALVIALLLALLSGGKIIAALKKASFGQEIREEGPAWHRKKSGTPTMGNLQQKDRAFSSGKYIFRLKLTLRKGTCPAEGLIFNMPDSVKPFADVNGIYICIAVQEL